MRGWNLSTKKGGKEWSNAKNKDAILSVMLNTCSMARQSMYAYPSHRLLTLAAVGPWPEYWCGKIVRS
jgi:hypothetical protein